MENLTLILAVWGAILSTALGVLRVFEYRRGGINVKISLLRNRSILSDGKSVYIGDYPGDGIKQLEVSVSNMGVRPVTIEKIALLLPSLYPMKYAICNDIITGLKSVELKEGKSHSYFYDEEDLSTRFKLTFDKYVALAVDATGRRYWSHDPFSRFVKLRRFS